MTDRPNPMRWDNEPMPEGVFLESPDPEVTLLGLPSAIASLRPKVIDADDPAVTKPAARVLHGVLGALRAPDGPVRRWSLDGLDAAAVRLILDTLGEGEVDMVLGAVPEAGLAEAQVQESVMPGLWIERTLDDDGAVVSVALEVGDVPAIVRQRAARLCLPELGVPATAPAGTMNVLPVLAEIRHLMGRQRSGRPNHVINFTLLPMTPEDQEFLTQVLGRMPITIVSGGYGACKVLATGMTGVWAVQYMNSMGVVILDTLEIGDVPSAARAAAEDFEDSAERLSDILAAYFPHEARHD